MSTLAPLSDNGRGYGGYAEWRHEPELTRVPGPADPQADSMEAMQERHEREDAVTLNVQGRRVTRAEVQAYPFTVLHALQERVPTLTWVKCSAFEVALISDGERHANGPTLASVLCEYLEV